MLTQQNITQYKKKLSSNTKNVKENTKHYADQKKSQTVHTV